MKNRGINQKMLADRYTELREFAGIPTQKALAEEIGLDKSAIGFYENGTRKLTVDALYKYADFFDVSTDYLLGLTDVYTNKIDIKNISEYTKLSEWSVMNLHELSNTNTEYTVNLHPFGKDIKVKFSEIQEIINSFLGDDNYFYFIMRILLYKRKLHRIAALTKEKLNKYIEEEKLNKFVYIDFIKDFIPSQSIISNCRLDVALIMEEFRDVLEKLVYKELSKAKEIDKEVKEFSEKMYWSKSDKKQKQNGKIEK